MYSNKQTAAKGTDMFENKLKQGITLTKNQN